MTYIALRNGPAVHPDAIVLGCALEAKACHLSVAGGKLQCSNGSALTAEDRTAIVQHKRALMALADYRAPEGL